MRNLNNKYSEFIIMLFIFLLSFCKGIGLSSQSNFYLLLFCFGTLLTLVKLVNEKYNKKELFCCVLLILLGLMDYLVGKVTSILFTAIILLCLKNIDLKKIVKVMFYARLLAYIGVVLLTFFSVLPNESMLFYREGTGFITRYSFVFGHPNLAHSSFTIIVFLGVYLFYDKLNIFTALLINVINYILYLYTYSRTGFLLCLLTLILALFYKKSNFVRISVKKVLPHSLFIFTILSGTLGLLYNKLEFVQKLDILLTGRLSYINVLLRNYSIPIIGSDIFNEYVYFDNGYITLLYQGGLLVFCIFCFISYKSNKIIIKNNMEKEALLIFSFLLYSFTESYYTNILMNVGLIYFSLYIFNQDIRGGAINNESNDFNTNI